MYFLPELICEYVISGITNYTDIDFILLIFNSKNLIECLSIKFPGSNFIESYMFNNSLLNK